MWSGPRNLSTALMRSFGNHPATISVMDEPFYAAYLHETKKKHPMRKEILSSQPTERDTVIHQCTGTPVPEGGIVYQKHMTHHMLPGLSVDWMDQMTNVFLIRDPRRVVASYARRHEAVGQDDIGFFRQAELFNHVADRTGTPPPVIEAEDIRRNPDVVLGRLCDRIGIEFHRSMLSWPAGPRKSDGIWASHWYASLRASTAFATPDPDPQPMAPEMEALAEAARPAYEHLRAFRL